MIDPSMRWALLLLGIAACAPRTGDVPNAPEGPRVETGQPPTEVQSGLPTATTSADVNAPLLDGSDARPSGADDVAVTPSAPAEDPPAAPVSMRLGHERSVWVLPGKTATPIIYLHGRCGDPKAFTAFARAASNIGTLVSFVGDQACADGARFKWSGDVVNLDKRITRTLAHVGKELHLELGDGPRIAMGYSQGSLMAEALGTRFPERYPRVVLIGGPRAPKDHSLEKSQAILLMAGDKDARLHLRAASADFKSRGKNANYVELPGARHGEYGEEAERVMAESFSWLLAPTE